LNSETPVVYLDNAATTFPKPEAVYRDMDSVYRSSGGNAGRGANPLARRAAALVAETRELAQTWLSAPEVTFSPSATIALNTIIFGANLRTGDVVYVSPFEHNSVARPLEHLRKTLGIVVRQLSYDKQTMVCNLDAIRAHFRIEPPSMICVSHVSNVFGILSPVEELALLARQASPSVIVLIDGAQSAGLVPLELANIDALVFSGHKSLYGPYGIAGVAFGRDWRPAPFIYGGTGTRSESLDMPSNGSDRYEAGSQNISAVAGLRAALIWLKETGRCSIYDHVSSLTAQLTTTLAGLGGVFIYPSNSRVEHSSVVSFNINGVSPQIVETALGARSIAVRAGLHCAPWAHDFASTLTQGGTVRTSLSFFNTEQDVLALAEAIDELLQHA